MTTTCPHFAIWQRSTRICRHCAEGDREARDATPPPVAKPPTRLQALTAEVGVLVEQKQAAYGDSFGRAGQVLKLLYPNGIAPEQYTDALAVIRVVDKLFRVANKKDAFGESPWRDIAGYGLLGLRNDMANSSNETPEACPQEADR